MYNVRSDRWGGIWLGWVARLRFASRNADLSTDIFDAVNHQQSEKEPVENQFLKKLKEEINGIRGEAWRWEWPDHEYSIFRARQEARNKSISFWLKLFWDYAACRQRSASKL